MQVIDKLILGTVQFGLDYGVNNKSGRLGEEEVNSILDEAFEVGLRTLDSAEAYGDAHEMIGAYHFMNKDRRFKIITKLTHHFFSNEIKQTVDKYRDQLKVKKLHALLFHSYKSYKENIRLLDTLSTLKEEDVIENLGVSIYTNTELLDVIENPLIDIIQLPFNLFDNDNLRGDAIKAAKDKGKIIHVRSVFLQGLFFLPRNTRNKIAMELSAEMDVVEKLSQESQLPLQTIALNYCLQKEYIDGVLIGVDNVEQLKKNLQLSDRILPQAIVAKIDRINIKNINLLNPSLW